MNGLRWRRATSWEGGRYATTIVMSSNDPIALIMCYIVYMQGHESQSEAFITTVLGSSGVLHGFCFNGSTAG